MDKKLPEILVCPQCRGSLISASGALVCKACQLKYPIRDGIPIMLVDEAASLKGNRHQGRSSEPVATFRIIGGPNKGLSFHLDHFTCKALGRAASDPNKTAIFGSIDTTLALDEGTKGLIQHYVGKQFKDTKSKADTGSFKRTSDIILDDMTISRLHAMIFYGETGVGVLDLVSRNGTFVNGEEIESRLLKKDDAIELGETKIIFEG
ncbi:MAG: hypothetical protein A3I09_01125 [Deltaproteobacteria bacterium RIFCSPLOWO2_02_FULL_47_10]|nr:MAG: hypothetical protein A3I09_01125 [Deltaproteobacteria bacterium RIFCSPLOWO2_02_FULL_47_10]